MYVLKGALVSVPSRQQELSLNAVVDHFQGVLTVWELPVVKLNGRPKDQGADHIDLPLAGFLIQLFLLAVPLDQPLGGAAEFPRTRW